MTGVPGTPGGRSALQLQQRRASSHPDFHRRSRNSTGSAPSTLRPQEFADCHRRLGLSPTPEHVLRVHIVQRGLGAGIPLVLPTPYQGAVATDPSGRPPPGEDPRTWFGMSGLGPFSRAELIGAGATDRDLRREVATGRLNRLRNGVYCRPELDDEIKRAVALGGRLTCASELRRRGIWVASPFLHVHFPPTARGTCADVVRHFSRLLRQPEAGAVNAIDALSQATKCLSRGHAIAAIDSARHRHLLQPGELDLLVHSSRRASDFVAASDPAAESGLETLARLIARDLGLQVQSQVRFAGIGRVDLMLEGSVIVEADGDAFHTDAAARRRDRRRDAALISIGHPVLRFGYDQLVGTPDQVAHAMIRAVRTHRGVKDAGEIADRAVNRLGRAEFSCMFDPRGPRAVRRAAAAARTATG